MYSEEFADPIILKIDWNTDDIENTTINMTLKEPNNNKETIFFYMLPSFKDGVRLPYMHASMSDVIDYHSYAFKSNIPMLLSDTLYFYINPIKHQFIVFKNGLNTANILLQYTSGAVIAPQGSTQVLCSYQGDLGYSYDAPYSVRNGLDTSLAGGNVIIPPENWQYA